MFAKNKIRENNHEFKISYYIYTIRTKSLNMHVIQFIYIFFTRINSTLPCLFVYQKIYIFWLQNLVDQLCNSLILILFKLRKSMMSNLEIIHGSHTCIVGVNMDWQDSNILFLVINVIISCQPMLKPTTHYGFHELSRIWYV